MSVSPNPHSSDSQEILSDLCRLADVVAVEGKLDAHTVQEINITGCRVTEATIKALKTIPHIRIITEEL